MVNIKAKVLGAISAVAGFFGIAGAVHAQTPTITPVDPAATQLLVNGVGSIQAAIFSIAALIWPYALTVLLFFLAIRFGLRWFHGGTH